ncbi:DUF1405 domain-containing protein [Paenibacillus agilis]|uniref:DUF1405 domain-containing protein n=1 Tax=Paenibacillus agilis TaxID=3020863 RepID=A0A559IZ58_9BACL|nr:DUF1405 domain-containing protein [Paenibacillus agilis]TVX92911.1 DUF1405 domain-containing protein [Paenibacillus agilis]
MAHPIGNQALLTNRWVLWALFWSNALGTIYGYYWYKEQLIYTWMDLPKWQIVFVPDSPTASLFFTISLLFLLFPPKGTSVVLLAFRGIIEALAVVTSIKYGIWACVMIFSATYQGQDMLWQDWMLISSHLAMAIEALLYAKWFRYGAISIMVAATWTWLNDAVDYMFGVFPSLSQVLMDDLTAICIFTFILTGLSVAAARLAIMEKQTSLKIVRWF